LCGAIRFHAEGKLSSMVHCHCSMCRKHHGTAFATYVSAERVAWLSGQESVQRFRSSASMERLFCGTCGAKTPAVAPDGEVFVPAGNLTEDPQARPEKHIFIGSKAPWYEITDRLPQFEMYAPPWNGQPEQRAPRNVSKGTTGGSCLCGAVTYEYTGAPLMMMNCHCTRCQLGRSAAHASNVFVAAEQFRWRSGESLVTVYDLPGAARFGINFCATCGGAVPRPSRGTGRIVIPAGTLDVDPGVRPGAHMFVAYKAPWFEITDGRTQFPEAAT
jgi:hypothetical protein